MLTMLLTFSTLLAVLIGGSLLSQLGMIPAEPWLHFVLAAGIFPLSTTAIIFFAAVLSRRQLATGQLKLLPGIMLVAGCLVSAVSVHLISDRYAVLAVVLILAVLWHLDRWIRKKHDPHGHHPTLDWYRASLLCLACGLVAASLVPFLPEWADALRTLHTRISLYGFLGLSAVGTLQFLMSAVENRPDPSLGRRLRSGLPWALFGVSMLAFGDFLKPWGHALGAAFLSWPLLQVVWIWCRRYRRDVFALHGVAPMLCATLLGYIASLGGMLVSPRLPIGMVDVFLPGFVFPLISGAAGYLIPAWKEAKHRPTTAYINNHRLNHWSGIRAVMFLLSAIAPFFGIQESGLFGVAGLAWFEAELVMWALSSDGPTHKMKQVDIAR